MRNQNKVSQTDFAKILLEFNANKDAIQKRLTSGVPVAKLAAERGIPISTMRRVLDSLEIKHGHSVKTNGTKLFGNLLTVVVRIAKELNVNHDEIKPYL